MHDSQPPSKELGDPPLGHPGDRFSANEETKGNHEPQGQSITGTRLTLIIVALMSAMFLVALVSYRSTLPETSTTN